ncbi:lipase class 3 family protein [Pholiota conissans]|uniref:Lipase class 3 family protein n=1 Tax=Pholiota conissans TaxID=109636 RepID=A0A9P5ZEB9_9AGAR|nr:lipase class 3 family protein [Pholiota conissans]
MVALSYFFPNSVLFTLLEISLLSINAAGTPIRRQAAFSTLSPVQIAAFKPFTFYASTAYCQPSKILSWTCGANCNANPTFKPVASGGNGVNVQFWYVGYDPTLKTVIVGHQGTDPSKVVPLLTDAKVALRPLSSSLFPGVPSTIKVHDGFANEHAKTATAVLAAVKKALQQSKFNKVTLVGHSLGKNLGGALSLLESVYLPLFLPTVTFRMIGYGTPRVGNQAFATYIDQHVNLDRVNNLDDVVPILPGRFLGFHHPSGEKHIQPNKSWIVCLGDDNTDDRCSTGDVGNIFEGDVSDHDGPYDGVTMGC